MWFCKFLQVVEIWYLLRLREIKPEIPMVNIYGP